MAGTKGNKNALKHGFYAHLWTEAEKEGLGKCADVRDITGEIHLVRVIVRRIATTIPEKIDKKQLENVLKTMSTLTFAVASLSTLIRTNLLVSGELPETQQAILDALEAFRLEQGI